MRPLFRHAFVLAALWLLLATAAQAHDVLQASTDIYLRPGDLEIDLTMARVPSRSLAVNPPDIPITLDNFESLYHPLLRKNEPALFTVAFDGKPAPPIAAEVALSGETDIEFTLHYALPATGVLSVTSDFVNRMDDGYLNVLSVNQGPQVIGSHIEKTGDLTWKYSLGNPAAATPAASSPPVATPAKSASTSNRQIFSRTFSNGFISVSVTNPGVLVAFCGLFVLLIILLAIWFFRQKS